MRMRFYMLDKWQKDGEEGMTMTQYCPICNEEILGSEFVNHVKEEHDNRGLFIIMISLLVDISERV